MKEKSTNDLDNILENTHIKDFEDFRKENYNDLDSSENFSIYVKDLLDKKKLTQQLVFVRADIPERYGYKLLSGEKKTRQRDTILRICYGGEFTLEETQLVLKKYEMPCLYSKIPRDALLMIIFNERPGSIIDVNEYLKKHDFDPLRSSGVQE